MMHAKKRFGQHFLRDDSILQQIAAAIYSGDETSLIEIGPGDGALTAWLLADATRPLTVVEIDGDMIRRLHHRFSPARYPQLRIIHADALTIDMPSLYNGQTVDICGNLPYNIATPLIARLLTHKDCIRQMVFLLQYEVAARLAATAGDSHYSRLSVMTQIDADVSLLLTVPPDAFSPPPRVQSAVVTITPHNRYPTIDRPSFADFLSVCFRHRRKTIANNLRDVDAATFATAAIDPSARAQVLSLKQLLTLYTMRT